MVYNLIFTYHLDQRESWIILYFSSKYAVCWPCRWKISPWHNIHAYMYIVYSYIVGTTIGWFRTFRKTVRPAINNLYTNEKKKKNEKNTVSSNIDVKFYSFFRLCGNLRKWKRSYIYNTTRIYSWMVKTLRLYIVTDV